MTSWLTFICATLVCMYVAFMYVTLDREAARRHFLVWTVLIWCYCYENQVSLIFEYNGFKIDSHSCS